MTQAFRSTYSFTADDIAEREFVALIHPGNKYDRPADMLADRSLTTEQRRAVLSAWASDACAVPSSPTLRRPAFATRPVTFDEIMDALRDLDRGVPPEIMKRKLSRRGGQGAVSYHG